MQFTRYQPFSEARDVVWNALHDVAILRASIPGCESLTALSDEEFELTVAVRFGPLRFKHRGRVRLTDSQAPEQYTMHFDSPLGQSTIRAHMQLEAIDPCHSFVRCRGSLQLGSIPLFGEFIVEQAVNKIAGDFCTTLAAQLKHAPAAARAATNTAPSTQTPR